MLKKIIIKGMSCSHCVNHVREALSELKDSQKVEVNLEQKYAIVETSSNDEEIKEKIEDSKVLMQVLGSDHCPVELDIKI